MVRRRPGFRRALRVLWLAPALLVGALWARSRDTMDEASAVDADGVLRAVVSYGGAVHWIRAENNSTPRAPAWDRYDAPAGAPWAALYPMDDLDWRRLGVVAFSSPRPGAPANAAAVNAGPANAGNAGPANAGNAGPANAGPAVVWANGGVPPSAVGVNVAATGGAAVDGGGADAAAGNGGGGPVTGRRPPGRPARGLPRRRRRGRGRSRRGFSRGRTRRTPCPIGTLWRQRQSRRQR